MLNKICKSLKQAFKRFDEIFSLEMIVFMSLIFMYLKDILDSVKSFDEFTSFHWFVAVSFASLVFSNAWMLSTMLEIKRFIASKNDDRK